MKGQALGLYKKVTVIKYLRNKFVQLAPLHF